MVFIIGFGAMVLVGPEAVAKAGGGGNMAAPLLALAVGGNAFFGFICAVAFATMLAVVAGLTLSGVATLCHDVWTNVVRNGTASETEQLKVARVATVVISILAIILGIAFEGQNVAFMAGLAFSIACAANFPSLVLAITWRRFTTSAAVASILVGTLSSLVLIYLSPTIQVDILGKPLAQIEHRVVVCVSAQPGYHLHAAVVLRCDHPVAADDGGQRRSHLRRDAGPHLVRAASAGRGTARGG